MTEHVGAFSGGSHLGGGQGPTDDRGNHGGRSEPADGSDVADENAPAVAWRPATMEVGGNGFPNVGQQRQLRVSPTLAANGHLAGFPVNVLQIQCDDLSRS